MSRADGTEPARRGVGVVTNYYALTTADAYSEHLSRFPRASTRETMCTGCCEIRPDWGLRPVEVHLKEAPSEPGPVPGIMSCVVHLMKERLWQEIGPKIPDAAVGPVVWGPERTPAVGWVSVHTSRSSRVLLRATGERRTYERCDVCGAWRLGPKYIDELYLVQDEIAGRSIVCAGARFYVSPEVRRRLARLGIAGLDFGRIRVCEGPKTPLE